MNIIVLRANLHCLSFGHLIIWEIQFSYSIFHARNSSVSVLAITYKMISYNMYTLLLLQIIFSNMNILLIV